jgi:uncharacterized protein (TIGR02246 family)
MTIRPDQDEAIPSSADEAAIRDLFHKLLDDRGRGDGEAYGSRFTEDADYIGFDGSHNRGQEAISSSHQQLFDKFLKDTALRVRNIKFLSPEITLVPAAGSTVMRDKPRPAPERASIQTFVAVKHGGEWLFAAFHNTRVRPI